MNIHDKEDLSELSILSSDNTSDGWLKKKWIIENGERNIIKDEENCFVNY